MSAEHIDRRVPIEELPQFLRVDEAGEYLGIGRTCAYELVRIGAIESIRLGRLIRIPREALRALGK